MRKSTDDLFKVLKNKDDIDSYLKSEKDEILEPDLAEELERLLVRHHRTRAEIISETQLERSYVYHLFSGRNKRPSRNVLLQIGIAMRLELSEMQQLLRIAGFSMLYPRIPRDAIVIHALNRKLSVMNCNELLYDHGEPTL